MKLELSSLKKAIASMDRTLQFSIERLSDEHIVDQEAEVVKAAVIQNFEFTYELCWKFMKRWLEANLTPGMMEGITRKELFRYAVENHLISDFYSWVEYHEMRNKTSHTYDSDIVEEIYMKARDFLKHSKEFFKALETRND